LVSLPTEAGLTEYVFGDFRFALPGATLSRSGKKVVLGQRAAALLALLVAERGQPISKARLMEAGWPGLAVEESNLTVQMAALRRALGTAPSGTEWVMTIPRVGYRFLDELEERRPATETTVETSPSVAVLPFANLSADPEQDFFARGLAEDLITDLSKVGGLTVIARSSSFAHAARDLDPSEVAAKLGVQFVVEGSVRRAATTIRINAQLIDAAVRRQIWAHRMDGDLQNIFALQDEMVRQIVVALGHIVPPNALQRAKRPMNLEAYDLFTRGRSIILQSPEDFALGQTLLERATALDPGFAEAYAWIAMGFVHGQYLWASPDRSLRARGIAAARTAIELDPDSAAGHAFLGYSMFYDGDLEGGSRELQAALALEPNYADAWMLSAETKTHLGDHDAARTQVRRAYILNPYPPGWYYWARGFIEFASGDYEDAIETLSHIATRRSSSQRILAAALAQLGRIDEARREGAEFLSRNPHFSIARWIAGHPAASAADMDRFAEGYRLAGLPS
jgi:TolB-like protein